jgi:hypothetical protein
MKYVLRGARSILRPVLGSEFAFCTSRTYLYLEVRDRAGPISSIHTVKQ